MRISIAMATYNGAAFIEAQLQSFVHQTRRPDELVITDDCSHDATLEIVERFAARAPFEVRWSRNERNLGYAQNFNRALSLTTGDLVFLSDQDDVWFADKIETMAQIAEHSSALVLMNDAMLTDGELVPAGVTKLGQMRAGGLPDAGFVIGCCAAVKRDMLELCLPIPAAFRAHDTWIVRLADGMGRRHIAETVLQYYRRHGANESRVAANRTRPLTRLGVLADRLRRLGSSEALSADAQLERAALLLEGVRAAQRRAREPYCTELAALQDELAGERDALAARARVRKLPRSRRWPAAIALWRDGGYRRFSGLRSVIRDIVFL